MYEIEVKLRVKDLARLAQQLTKRGCALSAPIEQHDVIYSAGGSNKEFSGVLQTGAMVIRIRYLADKAILTLKQQRSAGLDNLELETIVSDPGATHQILLLLGYQPVVEVRKKRRKGQLGNYEICLDEVAGLGTFVELEKLTSEKDNPDQVREELLATLETLGLSRADEETRGYDTQIYLKMSGNINL